MQTLSPNVANSWEVFQSSSIFHVLLSGSPSPILSPTLLPQCPIEKCDPRNLFVVWKGNRPSSIVSFISVRGRDPPNSHHRAHTSFSPWAGGRLHFKSSLSWVNHSVALECQHFYSQKLLVSRRHKFRIQGPTAEAAI